MTPEQFLARKKKLASAARALITGELGLVAASRNIERALRMLGQEAPEGYEVFSKFYNSIPLEIPLGTARLQWKIEHLLKFDAKLSKVETKFRPELLKSASKLVEIYG